VHRHDEAFELFHLQLTTQGQRCPTLALFVHCSSPDLTGLIRSGFSALEAYPAFRKLRVSFGCFPPVNLRSRLAAGMPDEPAPEIPRRSQRHKTLKSGRIEFNGTFSTFDVTIKDMSETGVKLKLSTTFIVPPTFQLLILNTNTGISERRTCETRWQRGDLLGARFIDAPEDAPANLARAATLRRQPPQV
jgi:hypothetical protein